MTQSVVPVLVEDDPRDLLKQESRFAAEAACWEYLLRLQWLEFFVVLIAGAESVGRASTRFDG